MSTSKNKPAFRAVSVHNRNGKEVFLDIGAAWPSKTGGYVIRLQALPIGDTLILRPFKDKEEASAEEAGA